MVVSTDKRDPVRKKKITATVRKKETGTCLQTHSAMEKCVKKNSSYASFLIGRKDVTMSTKNEAVPRIPSVIH